MSSITELIGKLKNYALLACMGIQKDQDPILTVVKYLKVTEEQDVYLTKKWCEATHFPTFTLQSPMTVPSASTATTKSTKSFPHEWQNGRKVFIKATVSSNRHEVYQALNEVEVFMKHGEVPEMVAWSFIDSSGEGQPWTILLAAELMEDIVQSLTHLLNSKTAGKLKTRMELIESVCDLVQHFHSKQLVTGELPHDLLQYLEFYNFSVWQHKFSLCGSINTDD